MLGVKLYVDHLARQTPGKIHGGLGLIPARKITGSMSVQGLDGATFSRALQQVSVSLLALPSDTLWGSGDFQV